MTATVAGYYRVSVARDGMQAPQMYEEQIRAYCNHKNLDLARIYNEIAQCSMSRPLVGHRPRIGS